MLSLRGPQDKVKFQKQSSYARPPPGCTYALEGRMCLQIIDVFGCPRRS